MYDKAAEIHEHAAETPDISALTLTKISSQNIVVTRSLKQVGIKYLQVVTESSPSSLGTRSSFVASPPGRFTESFM